ncbi:kinase-like domain-containing protein [Blastocladiella britannica]|nr:kinase-like domain-containing protein [Blastocladiella britannica]
MYVVQKTLVEGQAGKIKLATHSLTGEQVVIKCLDKSTLTLDPAAWRAAMREIAVTASLNHPHIAPLLQVLDSPAAVQLVFTFEPGGDLLEFLVAHARDRTAEARTQHLAAQVVNALEHCHSRGIVHRDLKPDNILINTAGHVQLIDFGFTNVLDEEAELMSTFCGSLAYAAPEMLAKQPYVGMPVDVWSLGVTLFVLVSGYLPFDEGNVARMYQHMMASDIEFPESMSPELKHMLKRMMDPDPTTRPTMREVQQFAWFDAERRVSPQLFVPSAARPDDGSPPPLMRVHPETLVAMAARWPRSFPDVARTRTCVETRTPSHEFATYMLMLERARRVAHGARAAAG